MKKKNKFIIFVLVVVLLLTFIQNVFAYMVCPNCGGRLNVGTWFCRSAAGADTKGYYCYECGFNYQETRNCIHYNFD